MLKVVRKVLSIQQSESSVIKTLFEMSGITKEKIEQEMQEMIRESSRPVKLFWDINQILEALPFEKSFLEEHILTDPRVRQYQRQRGPKGKRVWLYEPSAKVIQEIIMNEWN